MKSYQLFATILALIVVCSDGRVYINRSYSERSDQENCQIKSHGLKTIKDVQDAIDKAKEGAIIHLDPIIYEGDLYIKTKNNRKYISITGDNQCHKNTVIRGKVSIEANNWIINAIVFENTDKAIVVRKSENIKLRNLVINKVNGNAITVQHSTDVQVDNLVVDNIGGNAVDFSYSSEVGVKNAVISNVGGVALNFDNCYKVNLVNNVFRNVVKECIKVSGATTNVNIAQTVINGDSQGGEGWMWLEGDHYSITNTVATGAPKNGIVVNGCNYSFSGNIFTMRGYGYSILFTNKNNNCHHDVGITNLSSGGRGLSNSY